MKKICLSVILLLPLSLCFSQNVNIPDTVFKSYLVSNTLINTNGDDEIQESEADIYDGSIKYFGWNLSEDEKIHDLTGIEFFHSLKELDVSFNEIPSVNLVNNVNLEILDIDHNNLTSLDLAENNKLTDLVCGNNNLVSINILDNILLERLSIINNDLKSIDVKNNVNLKTITCYGNDFESLDITKNTKLEDLRCSENLITDINLSQNTELNYLSLNDNLLSSIDLSNNIKLETIYLSNNGILSVDLSKNKNLSTLSMGETLIESLDLSKNTNIEYLYCSSNSNLTDINLTKSTSLIQFFCDNVNLTQLDLSGCTSLKYLNLEETNMPQIDLSNCLELIEFNCKSSQFTNLDLSNNSKLESLDCWDNKKLTTLNLKNGGDFNLNDIKFGFCTELIHICVDEKNTERLELITIINKSLYSFNDNLTVNTYCSFKPGGVYKTISGNIFSPTAGEDCGSTNAVLNGYTKLNVLTNNEAESYIVNTGSYEIGLIEGVYEVSVGDSETGYFNTVPEKIDLTIVDDFSPEEYDFCIMPSGDFNDLEVTIIPMEEVRPGFDTKFRIVYANKGTTVLSGEISFNFNNSLMDFLNASVEPVSQVENNLKWNFNDLSPLEIGSIDLIMNINSPQESPAVNGGDILTFTSEILFSDTDQTPTNNLFELNMEVVNSFDPNDIRCLEGSSIATSKIGDYIHYLIRFENTGTANAVNVVVKDIIDANKFDINTVDLLSSSHNMITKISETNKLEFIFEDINLPFDDANNDGFVCFKIKILGDVTEDDTLLNQAEIYFDFNFPIITNEEETTFNKTLSNKEVSINESHFYPNPVLDYIHVKNIKNIITLSVYNLSGKVILKESNTSSIAVSNLKEGMYLLKITTEDNVFSGKFIKK